MARLSFIKVFRESLRNTMNSGWSIVSLPIFTRCFIFSCFFPFLSLILFIFFCHRFSFYYVLFSSNGGAPCIRRFTMMWFVGNQKKSARDFHFFTSHDFLSDSVPRCPRRALNAPVTVLCFNYILLDHILLFIWCSKVEDSFYQTADNNLAVANY